MWWSQEFEPSIEGLIHRFFADLEKYHGKRLVGHTVGYMCASDGGKCPFIWEHSVFLASLKKRLASPRLVRD